MPPPSVLLVHGFASSFERNWREPGWVDLLEEAGHPVLGCDLPGHGAGARSHEPEAYANLDRAVEAALPDEPVDAVGFSLGAVLLLTVAARTPERFGRMVVGGVGANVFRQAGPSETEQLARAVESGVLDEDAPAAAGAFARFARSPGNDPLALAACLRRPHEPLEPGQLTRVTRPVLVVLGDRDFAGPAEPLVEALPDARLVRLRGVDHFATPRDFGFIDAVLDFLAATA